MASPSLTDLNGAVTVSPQLEQSSPKSSETTSTCECSALHTINTSLSLLLHVNISCPCDPVPEEGPSIEGLSTSPKATIGECLLVCVCVLVLWQNVHYHQNIPMCLFLPSPPNSPLFFLKCFFEILSPHINESDKQVKLQDLVVTSISTFLWTTDSK